MKKNIFYSPTRILGVSSALSWLFIIPGIFIFREEIFIHRETISLPEVFILIGLTVIILFIISSILWISKSERSAGTLKIRINPLRIFGIVTLFIFAAEKIMVDEIGRELILGWEITGETIILNILFLVQIVYTIIILVKIFSKPAV